MAGGRVGNDPAVLLFDIKLIAFNQRPMVANKSARGNFPIGALDVNIAKVVVKNYRCLPDTTVALNERLNIVVGDNECGKSTFLEAIYLALSGQLNGRYIQGELHPHLFNNRTDFDYIALVKNRTAKQPPSILIELYFADDPKLARLKGQNNSLKEDIPRLISANQKERRSIES
jgi:predicted ATP-dependent endonuclease of OLD family